MAPRDSTTSTRRAGLRVVAAALVHCKLSPPASPWPGSALVSARSSLVLCAIPSIRYQAYVALLRFHSDFLLQPHRERDPGEFWVHGCTPSSLPSSLIFFSSTRNCRIRTRHRPWRPPRCTSTLVRATWARHHCGAFLFVRFSDRLGRTSGASVVAPLWRRTVVWNRSAQPASVIASDGRRSRSAAWRNNLFVALFREGDCKVRYFVPVLPAGSHFCWRACSSLSSSRALQSSLRA